MAIHIKRNKKRLLFPLLLLFAVTIISVCLLHPPNLTEDEKFEAFTTELFKNEIRGNTLNLHYAIAYPEKIGIPSTKATLGRVSTNRTDLYTQYQQYEEQLNNFSYSELSTTNQITLDTLLLNFHTEQTISDFYLLEEYLSPSLGIQAQLPVLLAEYTFRCEQDIIDYLTLLRDIKPYFRSILDYEKVKSEKGLFMCDETVDRIQEQCLSFISDPDSNYMLDVFSDKINEFSSISAEEKQQLLSLHKDILLNEVIPAYKELILGLEELYGTGKSASGLYYYPDGTKYYQYLLQSNAGIYTSIPQLEYQLTRQLFQDTQTMNRLINENPELLTQYTGPESTPPSSENPNTHTLTPSSIAEPEHKEALTPENMINHLINTFQEDFPEPVSTDYELCYVHESMEDYLSPAFYLTPPIDTGTPNIIYLNRASLPSELEIYTTLAHEGYPGHLYQTTYFTAAQSNPIRHLFSCNGYVEGWATYVESYAYNYASQALNLNPSLTELARLNRNATLCLYSLLDIGIHYRGWTEVEITSFLSNFGITEDAVIHEIFLYIVENPGNYLQYYGGHLNFQNLKTAQQEKLGKNFNLKDFHQTILEIGSVPFPILEKYINHEDFI